MRLLGRRLLVVAVAAGAFLPSACSSSSSVTVGIEGPMTGPQASTGIDMWRGAQLAADRINKAGGVDGRTLQLVKIDDRADPSTAVAVARAALKKHVSAVVGPYNSGVGVLNLSVYTKAGIPVVRLTSNHSTSGKGITLQPMDYQVAPFEASAIVKTAAAHRVAIVYDTSAYPAGVAEAMKSLLAAAQVPVVAFESITSDQTQFSAVLAAVKAAHPTLVYYAAYDPQAEDLVQQASASAVPGTCLVDGLAAQGPVFLKTVPLALAQKCLFSGVPTPEQFQGAAGYVADYKARFHDDAGTWGTFTYDSLGALAAAAKTAGSWSAAKLNPVLTHLRGYHGITGTTSIDPSTGDRVNPPLVMQTVDGSGRYIVTPEWSQHGDLPALPAP